MYLTQKTYPVILYCCIIVLFINFSCAENKKKDSRIEFSTVQDSIQSLVNKGRDKNLNKKERENRLKKASELARNIENDSLKTTFFSKISFSYLILGDSLQFRRTNRETMKLAKSIGDSTKQAEAHWDLADFYRTQTITDSSYHHFFEAQKIYSGLGKDIESGEMLYNMSVAQSEVKDYTGSEINAVKAIEILKPLNQNIQLYRCYSILGSVTKELKDYNRAIEYFNIALQYQKKIKRKNTYDLKLKNNIGTAYQEQNKYKESIPFFREVLQSNTVFKEDTKLYALSLNNLAYSMLKIGIKDNLANQFKKAIKIQDSIGDIFGISRTHFNFAEFYLNEKDTLQALVQAFRAQKFAKKSSNNDRLLESLQLLAKLQPKKSLAYNRKYIALNDSLQQEERKARNKFARIRFETDEFIAENQLLEREKQLWTSIAITILLLGLMSYFILDQRTKNQKLRFQQEQQAANQEIFNLMLAQNQKVEEGKKSEQKRISEELHDGVLGRMLGARMVLTGLNKKTDTDAELQRKKAIDALQDVEKEVRAISHELSHAAYQKIHNFIHSLEDLFKTVQNTGNFDYTFTYDEAFDWDGLNGETKINVYRMIQESLQNSVKHASCENVAVSLKIEENGLKVTVSDDGKGFKTNTGKKGIGMRNITSRINKLNGEWKIESALGKGTTVTLMIPLVRTKDEMIGIEENQPLLKEV